MAFRPRCMRDMVCSPAAPFGGSNVYLQNANWAGFIDFGQEKSQSLEGAKDPQQKQPQNLGLTPVYRTVGQADRGNSHIACQERSMRAFSYWAGKRHLIVATAFERHVYITQTAVQTNRTVEDSEPCHFHRSSDATIRATYHPSCRCKKRHPDRNLTL